MKGRRYLIRSVVLKLSGPTAKKLARFYVDF